MAIFLQSELKGDGIPQGDFRPKEVHSRAVALHFLRSHSRWSPKEVHSQRHSLQDVALFSILRIVEI
jgi:hypothetical protein